jgi:hypothetical protein
VVAIVGDIVGAGVGAELMMPQLARVPSLKCTMKVRPSMSTPSLSTLNTNRASPSESVEVYPVVVHGFSSLL